MKAQGPVHRTPSSLLSYPQPVTKGGLGANFLHTLV